MLPYTALFYRNVTLKAKVCWAQDQHMAGQEHSHQSQVDSLGIPSPGFISPALQLEMHENGLFCFMVAASEVSNKKKKKLLDGSSFFFRQS